MWVAPEAFEPLRADDPVTAGGYRLYARLGAGGMGRVYLSFTPGGRAVAVKVVRAEFAADQEFRIRFAQEALAAQRVNGIHVAQLLDADPDAERPWLATAYVPGPVLSEAVRLSGPLPPAAVLELTAGVAEALEAIHAAGIVHRDLKPGNVVLAADGPRVIDFGIARATDATALTLSGSRIGSPQYMAPEQVLGRPATAATDVFALGALTYYAATGSAAFGEGPEFGVVYRVVNEEPDLIGCPPELLALVKSCLAKEPDARPTPASVLAGCRPGGGRRPAPGPVDWLPTPVADAIEARDAALRALAVQGASPSTPAHGPPPDTTMTTINPEPYVDGPRESLLVRGPARRVQMAVAGALVVAGAAAGALVTAMLMGGPAGDLATVRHPAPTPAASTATPTATFSPTPSAPDDIVVPTGPEPDVLQWTGTVRFAGDGVDLDPVPPNVRTGSLQGDVREGLAAPSSRLVGRDANLALWPGPDLPTRQQCADLVTTQGAGLADVEIGDVVCVLTDEGRLATLTIMTYPTDFSGVIATARVWRLTPG